jgi:hypothetical protein
MFQNIYSSRASRALIKCTVTVIPHEIWETLGDHAKAVSMRIKTEPGVWPAGAGTMHPLAGVRAMAKGEVGG